MNQEQTDTPKKIRLKEENETLVINDYMMKPSELIDIINYEVNRVPEEFRDTLMVSLRADDDMVDRFYGREVHLVSRYERPYTEEELKVEELNNESSIAYKTKQYLQLKKELGL